MTTREQSLLALAGIAGLVYSYHNASNFAYYASAFVLGTTVLFMVFDEMVI